jgi:hypothetical protein
LNATKLLSHKISKLVAIKIVTLGFNLALVGAKTTGRIGLRRAPKVEPETKSSAVSTEMALEANTFNG